MKLSEIEKHLGKFRVGIAGAGGLGSNCAIALARCGVGTIVLTDFDSVELSNLSRQYYFSDQLGLPKTVALRETILKIKPETTVIAVQVKLDQSNIPAVFSGCTVIVEAFDSPEMKQMLIETVQNSMPGTPLVIGSGLAGWGNNDTIRTRKIDDTLFVCGDESTETDENLPPLAPRVAVVANMQANLVVEILMKKKGII